MTAARPTSESPFPYGHPGLVCYFTADHDGAVEQCRTRPELRAAVAHAQAANTPIFAVWPGQYRSDLFVVDDLDALAEAIA